MFRHNRTSIELGNRIRVLVVDDSVVIRRLVTHALSGDPDIEVVGSASSGRIALERLAQLNPDVMTLDIEMPDIDGLELLSKMRELPGKPRVIMFSTLTERGAAITLQALSLGADDYVAKAANVGSLDVSLASLQAEMIPKIKQFFSLGRSAQDAFPFTPHTRSAAAVPAARGTPKVLVIGVSTGGPAALGQIIPQLPVDFPLPTLIVQHMPPLFTRLLAERLQTCTSLIVEEASHGRPIVPGRVFIAPGDYHMRIQKQDEGAVIALDQSPPENSCRPAADVLFRSVGEIYGGDVICAILTGMGQDGLRGIETLKARGAYVIAQDQASSTVWGMPGAVVSAGLADSIVPLHTVIPQILRKLDRGNN